MTQSPHSGQAAPPTTDFGSERTAAHAAEKPHPYGAHPSDAWGATSVSDGSANIPSRAHARSESASPPYADAPTMSVPLVDGDSGLMGPPSGRRDAPGTFAAVGPAAGSATAVPPEAAGRASRASRPRGPRRARLQLRNINPWTVFKFSCVLAIALFFVWMIVVGVLFGVLDAAGIIGKINDTVTTINGAGSQPPVTAGIVFGGAAIIGVVNIILFIALSTVGSVVYNLCADLVGGIEVTLSER